MDNEKLGVVDLSSEQEKICLITFTILQNKITTWTKKKQIIT